MIKYDASQTYSLEQFGLIQNEQIDCALLKLESLKEETMTLAYAACIVSFLGLHSYFSKKK
jgi:hypothetical protein